MPNKPRNIYSNNLYHVYNRSTEKRTIFYTEKDYNRFLNKMFFYSQETNVSILSYAILTNHFHLLLKEPTSKVGDLEGRSAISKFIAQLLNSYTKYFNYNKEHSGRIFQGPFKSKIIENDSYLQNIIIYINLNPVKHKIVKDINDWPYTSHHEFLNKICENKRITTQNDYFSAEDYKKIIVNRVEIIKKMNLEF
ncbi:MAG TPA: transposase [bacterium]|jgi:REP element-mobilizing transposase RayT|nr:transposase [bacterium]HOG38778.1 transposase [bacterium]HQI03603.1 transposase [bacterium]